MRILAVAVLVSPAWFLSTTLARRRILRVRRSCLNAALFSLGLTIARPVLPIRKDFRATLMSRAADGLTMFALRVMTPLVRGLPNTRMVSTPLLFTDTDPSRALAGALGGGGGGGGGALGAGSRASIAPTASTTPPVTVTPAIPGTGFAPFLSASTTCDGDAPGASARTSAATPAACGAAIDVPLIAV